MKAVDSNVLLRLLVGDVPLQAKSAGDWLGRQAERSVFVADAILTEVLFVLESKRGYGLARSDFMTELMLLLEAEQWHVDSNTALALETFAKTKLDYVDALLLSWQKSHIVQEVITFDKELQKALSLK